MSDQFLLDQIRALMAPRVALKVKPAAREKGLSLMAQGLRKGTLTSDDILDLLPDDLNHSEADLLLLAVPKDPTTGLPS